MNHMARTFKDAFCAHFGCRPEAYQREMLARSLYPQARPFWRFLDLAGGKAMMAASTFIELAGQTQTKEDLMDVINEYRDDIKPHSGFVAQVFKIRVSVERLVALHDLVRKSEMQNEPPSGVGK